MRFPKLVKHRKAEVTIYGKRKNYPFYRIAYRVAGKRVMQNFSKYAQARKAAEDKAKELDKGLVSSALTASQSRDALAALQRLEALQSVIGRKISLLAAVSEFADASTKLRGRHLAEVVDAYLNTTAKVKQKDVSEAVEEFITQRKPLEEILRLEWDDIWQVPDHIEIKAQKAKTRSRRLVSICPALAAWIQNKYRNTKGLVYSSSKDTFHKTFTELRDELKIPPRRNGLRHAFCTYHFAKHANENLTAQQAGNSPAMIHQHYKGLATKAEADKWFEVMPGKEPGDETSNDAESTKKENGNESGAISK
jgi:hypothetical protein